jgi:hypothetical protein
MVASIPAAFSTTKPAANLDIYSEMVGSGIYFFSKIIILKGIAMPPKSGGGSQ